MSTQLTTQNTAIRQVSDSEGFGAEQLKMLSDSIMKNATPGEIQFFAEVCKRTKLDPFKRQIHAVQRWDSTLKRMAWTFQTGIDGYIAIAHRDGLCAGIDDVKFLPEDESTPNPTKATVTVWKIVGNQRVPFTASARWEEYVQLTKEGNPNSMWRKMPYGQLGKCATALALRKAFPEELGAILTDVEMEQADSEGERPGPQPKGRSPHFTMESQTFEKPAELPAPKPAEAPAPAPKQEAIDAEVVASLKVPDEVAAWTHGKWKKPWGDIKGKALAEKREAALEANDANAAYQALASIYDETQARITAKKMSESDFADLVFASDIKGIEFPADLWETLKNYRAILAIAKALK